MTLLPAHNLRMRLLQILVGVTVLMGGLAGCTAGGAGVARSWIDSQTAVAVTAQTRPIVLSREDFPAGVNVRDYAELGAFEVNRSGRSKSVV